MNKKVFLPSNISEWSWNLFLVSPSWYPIEIKPRLVSPAWALTVEVFYYLLISFGISSGKKICWFWFLASLIYYFSTYFMGYDFGWRSKGLLCGSLAFSLGSLLYYYKDRFHKFGGGQMWAKWGVLIFYSVVSIGSYLVLDFTSPIYADVLFDFSIIPSALAIIVLYPDLNAPNPKAVKVDRFFGGLSYPLYILHWPLAMWIVWAFKLDPDLGLNRSGLICFFLVVSISAGIGFFFEKYCEPKFRKMRRLI